MCSLRLNAFPHMEQANGRSPVWIRRWFSKWAFWQNVLPHVAHGYGLSLGFDGLMASPPTDTWPLALAPTATGPTGTGPTVTPAGREPDREFGRVGRPPVKGAPVVEGSCFMIQPPPAVWIRTCCEETQQTQQNKTKHKNMATPLSPCKAKWIETMNEESRELIKTETRHRDLRTNLQLWMNKANESTQSKKWRHLRKWLIEVSCPKGNFFQINFLLRVDY